MFEPMLPLRLAHVTSELVLRNAATSVAMWTEAVSRTAEFWVQMAGQAADSLTSATKSSRKTTRSWYRHPDATPTLFPFAAFTDLPMQAFVAQWGAMIRSAATAPTSAPFMGPLAGMLTPPNTPSFGMLAPWQTWLRLFPLPTSATTWPMAAALMAAGMPQGAAWPTAEAGAHVLAATQKAVQGIEEIFASYRSEGGHALAQITWAGRVH